MEFRETLLAAQRNQQQQSSRTTFYKAKFDPPKKEQKQRDKLSANIQKFLAKKDEEEKQKQLDVQRKKDELFAMRDQKALRKIQKTLKVIKSANKSVIADAIDENNTAVTRDGPDQPDQDDYGYESQEAAALYEKMMQKYSKIPVEPKFPVGHNAAKKDLKGTMERVKHALQHEDDPVPHKRRRKGGTGVTDKEDSPTRYEPEKEKKKEEQAKSDKPKFRKPAPPPMDFNQLLKLAEQKKSEPIEVGAKKAVSVSESERPMTKRQRREYEEEMARKQRRLERLEADKGGKRISKEPEHRPEKERPAGFGRIPKLGDKNSGNAKSDSSKSSEKGDRDKHGSEKDKLQREIERATLDKERLQRERDRLEKERAERDSERMAKERLDQLKAERLKIERDIERLNRDRERLDKTKSRLENGIQSDTSKNVTDRSKVVSRENGGKQDIKKNIDLKSQNTYRIDKNSNDRKFAIPSKTGNSNGKYTNEDSAHARQVPKSNKNQPSQMSSKDRELMAKHKLATNGALKTNSRIENGKKPDPNKVASSKRPEEKASQAKLQAGSSKPKVSSGFDFDKHINSIGAKIGKTNGARQFPPGDVRRKQQPDDRKKPKRRLDSDSEYDSEMDDFIDDGDENEDYSTHIKEIFGYDKSKYRYMDDDDDPSMESSFARQQREEYISKKIGIMEDLEDMRMEAMEKKKTKKKGGRRISDDED